MMDLLVQVTTSNKISPSGHVINVCTEKDCDISYKPNTPIGSLDTNTIYIVPKSPTDLPVKKMNKLIGQPFEQTFRLQVNLPRNQLLVLRVSPRTTLSDVKKQVCQEKELDPAHFHLVHPFQPDSVLDLNSVLADYGCTEISLMSSSGLRESIRSSSTDRIAYPSRKDQKERRGIFRLFSKKSRESSNSSTNGVNSRGVSPERNEVSNKVTSAAPRQGTFKKRPAPAPPSTVSNGKSINGINSRPNSELSTKTEEGGGSSSISHSRQSSDSSGYHEPSVFSDYSENKSPETSSGNESGVCGGGTGGEESPVHFPTESLSKKTSTPSKDPPVLKSMPSYSNVSIISTSKKRKAPPPPPSQALKDTSHKSNSTVDNCNVNNKSTSQSPTSPEPQTPSGDCFVPPSFVRENEVVEPVIEEIQAEVHAVDDCESPVSCDYKEDNTTITNKEQLVESVSDTGGNELEAENIILDVILPPPEYANSSSQGCKASSTNTKTNQSPVPVPLPRLTLLRKSSRKKQTENTPVVSEETNCAGNRTSLDSIADLEANFKQTIEEAELVIEREEKMAEAEKSAIASEQSVNVQEVPSVSSENLAEQNCDQMTINTQQEPCTLDWDHGIPDPPSPFRTNEAVNEFDLKVESEKPDSSTPICENDELQSLAHDSPAANNDCLPLSTNDLKENKIETKQEEIREKQTVYVNTEKNVENLVATKEIKTSISRSSKPNVNFTIGSYKNDVENIYASSSYIDTYSNRTTEKANSNNLEKSKNTASKEIQVALEVQDKISKRDTSKRLVPQVTIGSFLDRENSKTVSTENNEITVLRGKGHVQHCRAEFNNVSCFSPNRTSSLINLVHEKKLNKSQPSESSSQADNLKRAHSDQNLNTTLSLIEGSKEDFVQEQERLQQECLKLQEQYLAWQEQLVNNEILLQKEQIVLPSSLSNVGSLHSEKNPQSETTCQTKATVQLREVRISGQNTDETKSEANSKLPQLDNQLRHSHNKIVDRSLSEDKLSVNANENRSQTLPRQKQRPSSMIEKSATLDRRIRPRSQMVCVTIEPWQQRNSNMNKVETSSVASTRSKFQSLESLPTPPEKEKPSFQEQRKPDTYKNSETVSAELNSSVKKPNGIIVSSAVQSKPLVHISSMKANFSVQEKAKFSQTTNKSEELVGPALLAKIREEMKRGSRYPAGQNNHHQIIEEEPSVKEQPMPKASISVKEQSLEKERKPKKEEAKVPVKPLHITKINIGNSLSSPQPLVSYTFFTSNAQKPASTSVSDSSVSKNHSSEKVSVAITATSSTPAKESSNINNINKVIPPPPPPPLPTKELVPKPSQTVVKTQKHSNAPKRNAKLQHSSSQLDPREELMIAIRNFGGRQTLKKVPVNQANWHMKVFGKDTSVSS